MCIPLCAAHSDEQAYIDVVLVYDSEMPLVLKGYFAADSDSSASVTGAGVRLDVSYLDGTHDDDSLSLNFETGAVDASLWQQNIGVMYPSDVIKDARVRSALNRHSSGSQHRALGASVVLPLLH